MECASDSMCSRYKSEPLSVWRSIGCCIVRKSLKLIVKLLCYGTHKGCISGWNVLFECVQVHCRMLTWLCCRVQLERAVFIRDWTDDYCVRER